MLLHNLFDIRGKKAIVTGGTKGLGRSMAEALLESGCEVVVIGSSDGVHQTAEEYRSQGYPCQSVQADLRIREECYRSFEESLKLLNGELDILITAAGIQRRHLADEFPIEEWDEVININLHSVFIFNQLGVRIMLKKNYGKIINVTSMISWFGGQTVCAYAAAKGGVTQMTKAFANDLMGRGICVNAIAPGYMATDLNTALLADKERSASILSRIPAGRWGDGNDIKGATIFLASAASDYLSGANINVDGGYLVK